MPKKDASQPAASYQAEGEESRRQGLIPIVACLFAADDGYDSVGGGGGGGESAVEPTIVPEESGQQRGGGACSTGTNITSSSGGCGDKNGERSGSSGRSGEGSGSSGSKTHLNVREPQDTESGDNIHRAEQRNQETDRKDIGKGEGPDSSSDVLRTDANVAKAMGAAESDAGAPPVKKAKDESSRPNSSLKEGASPQPILKDGDSAVEYHDGKDPVSTAVEAAPSKASAVVGGGTLTQAAGAC